MYNLIDRDFSTHNPRGICMKTLALILSIAVASQAKYINSTENDTVQTTSQDSVKRKADVIPFQKNESELDILRRQANAQEHIAKNTETIATCMVWTLLASAAGVVIIVVSK